MNRRLRQLLFLWRLLVCVLLATPIGCLRESRGLADEMGVPWI